MRQGMVLLAVLSAMLLMGCGSRGAGSGEGPQPSPPAAVTPAASPVEGDFAMKLTSSAFAEAARIPSQHTCDGANLSPPLQIAGVPEAAKSLALVMDDPDAPRGTFDHWVVWNIPPQTALIAEGKEPEGIAGRNGARKTGYIGPCPPSGTHRYFFKLYALDATLELAAGSTKRELEAAMQNHILAQAVLMGTYSRK